ncbi:HlyD family type I secretion periplasmic adaptor subunit [Aestuariispira insulae]|uniref:Membrane fusion protein (MFP) family protein n=1 Tax=Aestuariispira insulae TaxID=1461337 RepID=A0A3D9HK60_9PROT|nr:HlyD family type I secretion periplasmic adaptor subunit [Aestuariispira insulae]RED49853.1 HlyD family secretion protein/epimerase transport system membrane fusion protein [Aestuariispira insulae]
MTEQLALPAPEEGPRKKPKIGGVILFGILVGFGFVGGSLVWAALAPLTSAAIASGVITVDSNVKTVQHLEGGIIREIRVKNGDAVDAGDLLMLLDDAQSLASFKLVNSRYLSLRALEARLIAERDGLESVNWPEEIVTNLENDAHLREIKSAQQAIFDARRQALELRQNILLERVEQLNSQVTSIRSQVDSASRQLKFIDEEVDAVDAMVKKGLERKPRLLKLQREQAKLAGDLGQSRGRIAETLQKVGETKLQILNVTTEHMNEVVAELREVQSQLDDAKERREASRDILERSAIHTPVSGVVENLQFFTTGGVIGPGEKIMDIVPKNDELIVEAKVMPTDIDSVYVGLPAKLTLSAFKQRTVPQLNGRVFYVASAREDDKRTGESFYTVRIRIPKEEKARIGSLELIQGMPVDSMIVTGESTFLNYLIAPIRESFERAFRQG